MVIHITKGQRPQEWVDQRGVGTCEELEPTGFTISSDAEREGNGISSMSSLLEPTCGGATVLLLTWSMWHFTTQPSLSSTTGTETGTHVSVSHHHHSSAVGCWVVGGWLHMAACEGYSFIRHNELWKPMCGKHCTKLGNGVGRWCWKYYLYLKPFECPSTTTRNIFFQ